MSAHDRNEPRGETWTALRALSALIDAGTLVVAGSRLGLHNATVLRRIVRLEASLGRKLFSRDGRGLRPTEAALELARIARETDDALDAALLRIRAEGCEIASRTVLSVPPEATTPIRPGLRDLLARHPHIALDVSADPTRRRLGAGEAHVAIRAGHEPRDPDLVVRPWRSLGVAQFAATSEAIPSVLVLIRSSDTASFTDAVRSVVRHGFATFTVDTVEQASAWIATCGAMGPMEMAAAARMDFARIAPEASWRFPLRVVYHRDQRTNPIVRALLGALSGFQHRPNRTAR